MSIGWTPEEIELQRPNVARVYDYYLGGSHNFAVDREMARKAIEMWPDLPRIIRANRAFLRRSVRYLAGNGVRQFLDLGSGMPTAGSVHEVARTVTPDARVAYIDFDPVVNAHARMILKGDDRTTAVNTDLRDPAAVLSHPDVRRLIDLSEPVGVLMVAVLHFVPDSDHPAEIIQGYRDVLVPGSHLVITHASQDGQTADKAGDHRQLYAQTATPMTMRSYDAILDLFDGWSLVEPGLVRMPLWRPEPGDEIPANPDAFAGYGGVGRLPVPAPD